MSELIEIGAMWNKTSQNGSEYFSVNIGGRWCKAFVNRNKKPDSKQPDWRILSDDEELVQQFGKKDAAPRQQEQGRRQPMSGMDEVPF